MNRALNRTAKRAFLACVLFCSALEFARAYDLDEVQEKPKPEGNPAIRAVNNSLSLSYFLSRVDYLEPSNTRATIYGKGYFDKEYGNINSMRFGLSWMGRTNFYVAGQYGVSHGDIHYSGGLQPVYQPYDTITNEYISDFSLRFGKGFSVSDQWMLTPYMEYGRRYWVRKVDAAGAYPLQEVYNHNSLGIGSLVQYAPTDSVVLTGNAMIGRTFEPWINVPDAGLDHAALRPSPVIKLGLEADYRLFKSLHVFAGGDYTQFHYMQTENGEFAMEPFSRTQVYNLSMGVRYAFNNLFYDDEEYYWSQKGRTVKPRGINPSILEVNRGVSLAFRDSLFYFVTPSILESFNVGGASLDSDNGKIWGPGVDLSWMTPEDLWFGKIDWNWSQGRLTNANFAVQGLVSKETVQEENLKLGRGFPVGSAWMATPYLGLGRRLWTREFGAGTPYDDSETYSHYYFGAGSLVQYSPSVPWVLTGDMLIGRTYLPRARDRAFNLGRVDLMPAPVLRLGLEGDWKADQSLHLFAGFRYEYFMYGQSAPDSNGVMELWSRTQTYTLSMGVRWAWGIQ